MVSFGHNDYVECYKYWIINNREEILALYIIRYLEILKSLLKIKIQIYFFQRKGIIEYCIRIFTSNLEK